MAPWPNLRPRPTASRQCGATRESLLLRISVPCPDVADVADIWILIRTTANTAARPYPLQPADLEDYIQGFAYGVMTSSSLALILSRPHHRRRLLLLRMARRDCVDFLRGLRRIAAREAVPLDYLDEDLMTCRAGTTNPAAHVLRSCLRDELQELLGSLGPARRQVFTAFYLHHESIAEIAANTGRTPGAIKECLCAGRRTLRARMEQDGWTEADVLEALALLAEDSEGVVYWKGCNAE